MSPIQRTSIREYYEAYWSEDGYNPEQKVTKSVLEVLQRCVDPADDCIDVGCGRGAGPSQWLNAHSGSYLGVDISRRAIDAARTGGLNVAEIADASELPCEDGSFDVAVSLEVFQNLFAPQLAAQEIWRVLRPGGRLIVSLPNVAHWRLRLDLALLGRWNPIGDDQSAHRPWRDPHIRFFGTKNLRNMLRETGFDPVEVGGLETGFLQHVPALRRLVRRQTAGPVCKRLTRAFPSLFARDLYAVATKPDRLPSP